MPDGTSKCFFFNHLRHLSEFDSGSPCAFQVCSAVRGEETMERKKLSSVSAGVAVLTMTLALGVTSSAQEQSQEPVREATTPVADQQRQKADGERHGLPIETYAVA